MLKGFGVIPPIFKGHSNISNMIGIEGGGRRGSVRGFGVFSGLTQKFPV